MGNVRGGAPEELVLLLKHHYRIQSFIETGTSYGNTASWAGRHFEDVVTIEAQASIHALAKERHRLLTNVQFLLGDSRQVLRQVVPALRGRAIFWLDGHWSLGPTFGEGDECPLLGEIDAINESETHHFLLIDDARLFLSPPHRPHRVDQWPDLEQVLKKLAEGRSGPRHVTVFEDVVVAVPAEARDLVTAFMQDANTRVASRGRLMQGAMAIASGLKTIRVELVLRARTRASRLKHRLLNRQSP
jgi:hypothetical protein